MDTNQTLPTEEQTRIIKDIIHSLVHYEQQRATFDRNFPGETIDAFHGRANLQFAHKELTNKKYEFNYSHAAIMVMLRKERQLLAAKH